MIMMRVALWRTPTKTFKANGDVVDQNVCPSVPHIFHTYTIHPRFDEHIFRAGRPLQQFIVDGYHTSYFISFYAGLLYEVKQRQFPICLAYAMTIKKSQGQTLQHVGIALNSDAFSHGQLYVAFSRATSPQHVRVLLGDNQFGKADVMRNVVYTEALTCLIFKHQCLRSTHPEHPT